MGDQGRLLGSAGSPPRRWSPNREGDCPATVDALAVEGEGVGRSRGGLSTKIPLAVDRRGLPLRVLVLLPPGQAGDNPQVLPLRDGIRVARVGPGRPQSRPKMVEITIAVMVDTIIIRSLLVPATMRLLGRWNWWLPGRPVPKEADG